MKIIENLRQVGSGELTSVEDAAIYLICIGEKAALIDAGCVGAHGSPAAVLVKNPSPKDLTLV